MASLLAPYPSVKGRRLNIGSTNRRDAYTVAGAGFAVETWLEGQYVQPVVVVRALKRAEEG